MGGKYKELKSLGFDLPTDAVLRVKLALESRFFFFFMEILLLPNVMFEMFFVQTENSLNKIF